MENGIILVALNMNPLIQNKRQKSIGYFWMFQVAEMLIPKNG